MIHVVSFSTGLSSALTAERVQERYGKAQLVFMNTKIEDDDNYRFMDDMRQRWMRLYGNDITILEEGRTPYQVAEDEHIIPNQKIAPCTFRLKIEMFVKYADSLGDDITIHIGYDWSEVDRIEATGRNYKERGWNVDFPLLWKPIEFRPYPQVCREDWNIEPPRMYDFGYHHANCGGVCVKQGWGDWIRTLVNFPERYHEAEKWEQRMRHHPKRQNYAILRDQSGGKVRPKTLKELREEYESSNTGQMDLFQLDYQSACVVCGIGDITT